MWLGIITQVSVAVAGMHVAAVLCVRVLAEEGMGDCFLPDIGSR